MTARKARDHHLARGTPPEAELGGAIRLTAFTAALLTSLGCSTSAAPTATSTDSSSEAVADADPCPRSDAGCPSGCVGIACRRFDTAKTCLDGVPVILTCVPRSVTPPATSCVVADGLPYLCSYIMPPAWTPCAKEVQSAAADAPACK